MPINSGEAKIHDAISKCVSEGSPEHLQELSEVIDKSEYLQENKHCLYKMIIKHLGMRDTIRAQRS